MTEGSLRPVRESDAPDILRIYSPFVINTPTSFEITCPTETEMRERIRDMTSHAPWWVYVIDDKVVGYAYASKHRAREAYQWAVEVSAYVDEDYKKCGIGRKLYSRLFTDLVERGFYVALAGVSLPNEASVTFHESMGFEKIGVYRNVGFKLGKWHDTGWWQKQLQDPTEPKPLRGNARP